MPSLILADNRLLDAVPVATDTAAGYNVLNLRDGKTYTHWRAATPGNKTIIVDSGSVRNAEALGIARHNLGSIGAQVFVESSDDGAAWTSRLPAFTPGSDRAFLKTFPTAGARWWKIGINAPAGIPQAAIVNVGSVVDFPRTPEAPFAPLAIAMEADSRKSKTAQILSRVVRFNPTKISPKWSHIEADFVDGHLTPFVRGHALGLLPFFFAWDFSARPDEVYFVRVPDNYEYRPQKSRAAYYDSVEIEFEGVLE